MPRVIIWMWLILLCAWIAQTAARAQLSSNTPTQPVSRISNSRASADRCSADEKCRAVAAYVAREFGPNFQVDTTAPMLTADLDGDGVEDAIIVATAKEVLAGQVQYHYKVIDPSNAYFGYGDPKVTMQFTGRDGPQPMLLIVHNWRAATPKAKFVAINLEFRKVTIAPQLVKKKVLTTIVTEDAMGMTSTLYWAGKQYKYEPGAE